MRLSIAAMFISLAAVSACRADMLTANFTIDNRTTSASSGGSVTFTLNSDGSISASLVSLVGDIIGFGFNSSSGDDPESGFSPTPPFNADGWGDMYGVQNSGFYCASCGASETWTITGPFGSVFDSITGTSSSYDFFLVTTSGDEWAGDAVTSSTPEPASFVLLLTIVSGIVLSRVRQRKINARGRI